MAIFRWRWTTWVFAASVTVLVAVLLLPVVSLRLADDAVRDVVEPGSSPPVVSTLDRPSSRRPDLGVRVLPLLTEKSEDAWSVDPYVAVTDLLDAVLGVERSEVSEAAYVLTEGSSPAIDWTTGALSGLDEVNAAIFPVVERAITSGRSDDVIDLASLLLLDRIADYQERAISEVIAYSLLEAMAEQAPGCDSLLSRAFAISLVQGISGTAIDRAYGRAVDACGPDPTAAVAWTYQRMFETAGRGCGNLESTSLEPLLVRCVSGSRRRLRCTSAKETHYEYSRRPPSPTARDPLPCAPPGPAL